MNETSSSPSSLYIPPLVLISTHKKENDIQIHIDPTIVIFVCVFALVQLTILKNCIDIHILMSGQSFCR